MSRIIDIAGKKFGRWTAIKHMGAGLQRRAMWHCRCECGNESEVNSQDLRDGHSTSCGCYNKELIRTRSIKKDSGERKLLRQYKSSAKKRGYRFELSDSEFFALTKMPCHYCGAAPERISIKTSLIGAYKYNGIDRKESSRSYTTDNSVACCYFCNMLKKSLGYDIFINAICKIYRNMRLEDLCRE